MQLIAGLWCYRLSNLKGSGAPAASFFVEQKTTVKLQILLSPCVFSFVVLLAVAIPVLLDFMAILEFRGFYWKALEGFCSDPKQ